MHRLCLLGLLSLGCKAAPTAAPASPGPSLPAPTCPPAVAAPKPEPEPTFCAPPVERYGVAERQALGRWYVEGRGAGLLRRRGTVRFEPDGPTYGEDTGAPIEVDVTLLAWGQEPRVAVEQGGVRLLVHVRRSDLQAFVDRPTVLRSKPGEPVPDPPTTARIEVGPGVQVDEGQTQGRWTQVTVTDPDLKRTGWVDAEALGSFYESTPFPALSSARPAEVKGPTVMVDAQGDPLVALAGGELVDVVHRAGNRWLISYQQPPCRVQTRLTGFVPRAKVEILPEAYGGLGLCGSGKLHVDSLSFGDAEDRPRTFTRPGQLLLAPDSNHVVGCSVEVTEVAQGEDGTVLVPTVWGPIPVRPAPASVTQRCHGAPDAEDAPATPTTSA